MAEHKIEDTNPPVARRAVRPFVGPAGAAAPARPLLRPTGPVGRPSPAPFAPPLATPRPALGTTANATPAAPATDATMSEAVAPVEPPELRAVRAPTRRASDLVRQDGQRAVGGSGS